MLKAIPAPTVAASVPPDYGRVYFEGCGDHPFDPHANHCSLENSWWMAEATFAAYDQFDSQGNARINLEPLRASGWTVGSATAQNVQFVTLEDASTLIVAFRGTRLESFTLPGLTGPLIKPNSDDSRTDASLIMRDIGHGLRVHRGFAMAFGHIQAPFESKVQIAHALGKQVWLCGHSLGGALALLGAWACRGLVRGLCTFGAPRVGNAAFASAVVGSLPAYRRFVHHRDLITTLPPEWIRVPIEGSAPWLSWLPFLSQSDHYVHAGEASLISGQQALDIMEGATASLALADLARDARAHFADILKLLRSGFEPRNPGTWPVLYDAIADHAPVYYANKLFNACVSNS